MKAILDEAGRIQLPDDVRAHLGVKPGDEVLLVPHAGEWVLRSAQARTGLALEGGVLVHRGTSASSATIDAVLAESRDERFQQLTEGFGQRRCCGIRPSWFRRCCPTTCTTLMRCRGLSRQAHAFSKP
jgi:bifunctional DNA-binding transcriptional regulator/antitoxin component of YhaV-PrlF toxin-antitoxin module